MKIKHFAILGFTAPALFLLTYFMMSAEWPEYSKLYDTVSKLGAEGAPTKFIWNLIGYIMTGVMVCIFSIGLHRSMTLSSKGIIPMTALSLTGVLLIAAGLFPADLVNPENDRSLLHSILSYGTLGMFLLAAFTYPPLMRETGYWRRTIVPSTLIALLCLLSALFFLTPYAGLGEMLMFIFYFLWILFMGNKMFHQYSSDRYTR